MAFLQAGVLASSLASKVMSAASLIKVSGAASGSVLVGLSSVGSSLPSQAALTQALSTLGPLLGSLKASSVLGSSACALTVSPLAVKALAAVLGGAVSVTAAPAVLTALGFTSSGIAASSLAAKMMSLVAIANGGGVPAGSLVAILQSAGAAGLSLSSKLLLGSTGSALVGGAVMAL
ncbi:interferon alpha-inducible protein 27, mitochondrial-like [Talpa occidentalis]|uniref:interferon alpha-inducible protein 27, mitochondrial-like n=1 Tax=Talpa occidentalis TaxID=50954 RepID=UPI0018908B7F|nr:interferon alpha-inducible protein 27, mitochondrial-like [Talpa occidentalis]XP_054548713.1 interferon alpha-inducible protein 27, mitochondrial-like [Talpa occidentalis]